MLSPPVVFSDTHGSLQGRAWDQTGAVVTGALVTVQNIIDGEIWTGRTNERGEYEIGFIRAGHYRITGEAKGFRTILRFIIILGGQRVQVDFPFVVANAPDLEASVTDAPAAVEIRSVAVQNSFTSADIAQIAGASESSGGIEAFTGTAWRSQEHLHIRGAHQVGYQVNGIAIQDLSSFEPLTPYIDPRNLKFTEVTTGGLLPEYGNRTAAVVNGLTRSGFDEGEHGRVETSAGNLGRESLFANFGSRISNRFAYYIQGTALASRRGMNPPPDRLTMPEILNRPERQDRHNFRRTYQNFGNFEWRPNDRDSVDFVLAGFRSDFQIPNTIEQQSFGRDYVQLERDHFQNMRWMRTVSAERMLIVSAYHHFNRLEVDGRSDDRALPLARDNRRADYFGSQVEWAEDAGRHLFKSGYGVYGTRMRDDLSILPAITGAAATKAFFSRVPAKSWQHSAYFQDQFDATDHLTLNYGGRLDVFSVSYDRTAGPNIHRRDYFLSPRFGFAYKLGNHQAVIFANAAYMFLPPPLEYFELPSDPGRRQPLSFTPVLPEKDLQYDVGVRLAIRDYRVRVNHWFKRQRNFLDHVQLTQLSETGEMINPNIFLPVNLDRARAHGLEAFVEAPSYRGLRAHANYSFSYAQGFGGVVHGFNDGGEPEPGYFFLDHDQRHRLYAGANYEFERRRAFVSANYVFGSAFPDASDGLFGRCVTGNCRLPKSSTVNLTIGKELTGNTDVRLEIENLTNRVYPINLGSEFNGSHVSAPRLVTLRLVYHF